MTACPVVSILMQRDGISEGEAEYQVGRVKDQLAIILCAHGSIFECESVVADMLGLESDYLDYLLPEG